MAVTILEIARKLGLSHTTVSRVLNNKPNTFISADTRQRVLDAAREMGYLPNLAARSLRDARTNIVGVFASPLVGIWRGITPAIARGISEVLGARNMDLFFAFGADVRREALPAWRFDGAIVLQASEPGLIEYLEATRHPFVCVNERVEGSPAVMADDEGGMRMAMEHLWALGHRRIAYANASEWHLPHPSIAERHAAYLAFLAERGAEPAAGHDVMPAQGEEEAPLRLSIAEAGATAVVAYDHVTAMDILSWAAREGLRVPDDLSLISFNDEFPSARTNPPLTVVAPQGEEMGRHGAELLLALLDGAENTEDTLIRVPERLVERGSTGRAVDRT